MPTQTIASLREAGEKMHRRAQAAEAINIHARAVVEKVEAVVGKRAAFEISSVERDALHQSENALRRQLQQLTEERDRIREIACRPEPHVSRFCEFGTGGCNVQHRRESEERAQLRTALQDYCAARDAELMALVSDPHLTWTDARTQLRSILNASLGRIQPGFERCLECGNLAMNPLPSCATCGSSALTAGAGEGIGRPQKEEQNSY